MDKNFNDTFKEVYGTAIRNYMKDKIIFKGYIATKYIKNNIVTIKENGMFIPTNILWKGPIELWEVLYE